MRYYEPHNNRLIYIESRASENYWDDHWRGIDASKIYRPSVPPFNFVVNTTRKYLPKNSLILEGGAGLALNCWYLYLADYRTIAIDFAPKTIAFLKKNRPEVCPVLGDVRNLSIANESVDGYWSLGVIEHFYDGYGTILNEMHRVIKEDGYLFLTFPHMSKLRQFKAQKGAYEKWRGDGTQAVDFYQFALDDHRVINDFENNGFKLVRKSSFDALKGLKDEIKTGRGWLQNLYNGRTLKDRISIRLFDLVLSYWSSHMALLVFKKSSG